MALTKIIDVAAYSSAIILIILSIVFHNFIFFLAAIVVGMLLAALSAYLTPHPDNSNEDIPEEHKTWKKHDENENQNI